MARIDIVKQGERTSQIRDATFRRKTCRLGRAALHRKTEPYRSTGDCREQPDAARLDQPGDDGGAACPESPLRGRGQMGAVVGHQITAQSHQRQRQRRLAAARGAGDQDPAPPPCHAAGMESERRLACQTGRPTTKRAPSGSEVGSASVGRMFSAQITPPCASTICLEMARPRPELLPNCCSGRSE